jgi:hypothetical protein
MSITIKNRLPIMETFLLSLVFIGCLGTSLWMAITISGISSTPLNTPIFGIGCILVLLCLVFTIRKRDEERGTLVIDSSNETFSVNGSEMMPFNELTEYKSKLANPMRSKLSTMAISIGTKENGYFSIIDADRFYFLPKGRSTEELIALDLLVNGSSLNETQKDSYSNWSMRAALVNS